MAQAFFRRKILGADWDRLRFEPGTTVLELVERLDLPPALLKYVVVNINGEMSEDWQAVLSGTETVHISVRPAGGGDGKSPLASLAMIAMVVASFAVGGVGGLTAGQVLAARIGITFVGSLIINSLIQPPSAPSIQDGGPGFMGISGSRNSSRLYGPVRNIYGTHKVFPDLAAENYVVTSGDIQTLYSIYDFGYGDVDLSDIRVGNTDIYEYTSRFKIHQNYTNGALTYYKNDNSVEIFNTEIKDPVIRETAAQTSEVMIDITFPLGLGFYDKVGSLKNHEITFDFQIKTGTGPWQSFKSAGNVRYSHEIALEAQDAPQLYMVIFEFMPDNKIRIKGGTAFSAASIYPFFNIPPTAGQVFSYRGVDYKILTASGITKWGPLFGYEGDRPFYDLTIDKAIPPTEPVPIKDFNYSLLTDKAINAGTSIFRTKRAYAKPFVFTVFAALPQAAKWQIRFDRLDTPKYDIQGAATRTLDRTVLTAITSIKYKPPLDFTKPHTILEMAVTATDQLSGMIDNLSAMAKRKIDCWTGTRWRHMFTDNPSDIALDILKTSGITDARINLVKFKEFHDFCNRRDKDGFVYSTCNMNVTDRSTVYEAVQAVLATGRGTLAIHDNKYSVVWDGFPTVPVQLFTEKNSWDFNATKEFYEVPDALRISIVDVLSDYQMISHDVYNDGFDATNAENIEEMSLPFITNPCQAYRDGRYYLAQGKLRPETVQITTDIENLICQRGDFVNVAHDSGLMGGIASRIDAVVNATTLKLDEPYILTAGKTYAIHIRRTDGTQAEISVKSAVDDYTFVLNSAHNALSGDLAVIGQSNIITEEFIVKSISPAADLTATLSLVPIARAIAQADQGNIPAYNPPIRDENEIYPHNIQGRITTEKLYENRHPKFSVLVEWDYIENTTYEVWATDDGQLNYELAGTVNGHGSLLIWDRRDTLAETYPAGMEIYVKVRIINSLGYKLPLHAVPYTKFTAWTDTTAPGAPLFFSGNINDQTLNLSWLPPDDRDIAGYMLKFNPDLNGPKWEEGIYEDKLIPYDATSLEINARIGSYMMKTIDTSGNISTDAAIIHTTLPQLKGINFVEKLVCQPAWTGSFTHTVKSGNALELAKGEDFGIFAPTKVIDTGGIYDCRISASAKVDLLSTVYMADWVTMAAINPISGATTKLVDQGEWNAAQQVRTSDVKDVIADWPTMAAINPISGAAGAGWSGWSTVTAGNFTGRYFQFRIILSTENPTVAPKLTEATFEVDMPDRYEYKSDVNCPAGGMDITFDKAFFIVPALAIRTDFENHITNKTKAGFHVEFFDHGNKSTAAVFDWVAQGYGELFTKSYPGIDAGEDTDPDKMPDASAHLHHMDMLT